VVFRRLSATTAVVACLGAAGLAASATARTTSAVTRTFAAHILSGTGRYAKATGAMLIELTLTPSEASPPRTGVGPEFLVTASLFGDGCTHRSRRPAGRPCLTVSGTVGGLASREPPARPIGDVPGVFLVSGASGKISPLGMVSAQGTLRGTGFVPEGRPNAWLALTGPSGSISIGGDGPLVGGFELP